MKYSLKYSGFKFIGDVPAHWATIKLRHVLSRNSEKNRADLPLLSVTREKGVICRDKTYGDDNHNYIPEDLTNYKVVKSGQFAMNKMKAWQGSYGISQHEGIVSPAYYVFDVHNVDTGFLHKVLRSKTYVAFFGQASDGVRTDQWDLNIDRMKSIPLYLPPVIVQQQIVRYLDYKNHLINKYIRIKKRQIELLKELKQVIINDAVTGKIDVRTGKPYPIYKDSGVDWLGMLPDEWSVLALGQCAKKVKTGGTPRNVSESHYEEFGMPWYTPGDFSDDLYLGDSARRLTQKAAEEIVRFPEGTVMMIGIGATIGKTCVTKQSASCNQQINAILVNRAVQPEYLALLLRCCRDYIVATGNYTTLPIINQERTKGLRIVVPELSIQNRITEFVSMRLDTIDDQIGCLTSSIASIRELQTRLISDVVTGKLDVRSIEIPDFEEELEELDEEIIDDILEEAADAD
ncbi:MAG: restriction endonuclease subunit S, partial [Candidatus Cloacimonetes bacterium]|nr:restriction endonuclease subunit S [Candidatus Cloacimonadota bacterium]